MQIQKYAWDRYTYPCRPKSGDHAPAQVLSKKPMKPTTRSCRGRRPPSTTSVAPFRESHTHGENEFLRAPKGRAAEHLDRKTSITAACLRWRNTHPFGLNRLHANFVNRGIYLESIVLMFVGGDDEGAVRNNYEIWADRRGNFSSHSCCPINGCRLDVNLNYVSKVTGHRF